MYVGFYTLSAGRQYNEVGAQPISYLDIRAWLDESRVTDTEERQLLAHYVRTMDNTWLQLSHDKLKRERDRLMSKSGSGNVSRPRGGR